MTHADSNAPRPYSRLETDDELTARIHAAGGYYARGGETVDQAADRHKLARRIVWVVP